MQKNDKVEMLFDDIRSYIDTLEKNVRSKENEIALKDRRIKILEENLGSRDDKTLESENDVIIDKSLLDLKSIYYLLANSKKAKNTQMIKVLFDMLEKESLQNISNASAESLLDSIFTYSLYDMSENHKKAEFIARAITKLNPDKITSRQRKIYTDIIVNYQMEQYIDEDFLIKFIRNCTFSSDYDIAKNLIISIITEKRIIKGDTNIQNIMILGLYLNIEKVRKLPYTESLYISAMNNRYDNMFINFLIGKVKLDYSQIEKNIQSIRVLNKNLVNYIYKIASEKRNIKSFIEDEEPTDILMKEVKISQKETKKVIKSSDEKTDSKEEIAIKSVYLNKNKRECDEDGAQLIVKPLRIAYYNSNDEAVGSILEHVLICKKCGKKIINSDIVRKIYRKISKDCHIKFRNEGKITLSMFRYNIGLTRMDRFELLKDVVCPALGVIEVINQLDDIIKAHKNQPLKDYTMSILEWENDRNKLIKSFGLSI